MIDFGKVLPTIRQRVTSDLTLPGYPDVSIIGDMASLKDTKGVLVPGLGSSAMQMGSLAATNILRRLEGQPPKLFTYKDKGSMATIGRNRAIAQVGALKLSGFIAWLAWCLVHVLLLIGFKNKALVLLEWAWSYVTGSGSVRLITGREASEVPMSRVVAEKSEAKKERN